MPAAQPITPCLWFDHQAEEAAQFYITVFPNSRITATARYTEVGREFHGREPGSVMTVAFELGGQPFVGLNGGPAFRFSEAVSFQVFGADQQEVDHYWERLTEGGAEQPCGWVKDRFGVSWQVVPAALPAMLADGDAERVRRVTEAVFRMRKPDVEALERAFSGA